MALDANITNVDAGGNVKTTLPSDATYAGYVKLAGELSESTDPYGTLVQDIRSSAQGRLAVGQAVMLFNDVFNYTTLNSATWQAPTTTQTVTVGSGLLTLNASAITTLNTVSRVTTWAFFPLQSDFATYAVWDAYLTQAPVINCTIEIGFIQCTASTAPTDGAFFRYDATGTLKAVLNNNGTEFTSAALAIPSAGVSHKWKIVMENDRCLFYIDGACQSVIAAPSAMGMPTFTPAQPFTARLYNGGTAPTIANTLKIGYVFVGLQDAGGLGKDNATIAAIAGRHGSQGQNGQTVGTTALYTNSLAAGAGAVMTNTTAALGTGLGGQFSALPTLAAGTDGIVCSYLNPAATANVPGKTLYIRGIRISSVVTTVLVGNATPVVFLYSLAYGHTSLSLATTESATAKAPRRIPLGSESFIAAAPVGATGSSSGVTVPFLCPIAVNPGEYVAIAAKNVGVITTSGVVTFLVSFDSYWE